MSTPRSIKYCRAEDGAHCETVEEAGARIEMQWPLTLGRFDTHCGDVA